MGPNLVAMNLHTNILGQELGYVAFGPHTHIQRRCGAQQNFWWNGSKCVVERWLAWCAGLPRKTESSSPSDSVGSSFAVAGDSRCDHQDCISQMPNISKKRKVAPALFGLKFCTPHNCIGNMDLWRHGSPLSSAMIFLHHVKEPLCSWQLAGNLDACYAEWLWTG